MKNVVLSLIAIVACAVAQPAIGCGTDADCSQKCEKNKSATAECKHKDCEMRKSAKKEVPSNEKNASAKSAK